MTETMLPVPETTSPPDKTPTPVVTLRRKDWIGMAIGVLIINLLALWIGEQYLAHQISSAFSNTSPDNVNNVFSNISNGLGN
jgi:hypothetical protein